MFREKGLFSFKLNFLVEEKIPWLLNFFWYYIIFTASFSISRLFKLMIATELKKKKMPWAEDGDDHNLKNGSQQQEALKASV